MGLPGPFTKSRLILIPSVALHSIALKDLRFVVKALKILSARWEDIGMAVDVKGLDEIKRNYQGTCIFKSQ